MATYEDIARANETIKTTPIKGKNYAEVPQRVKAFRMLHPNGTIDTQIISNQNGVVVIKATVADDAGNILATGHAYEKESSSFINKTSYIENCETSSIGRALGIAGYGIDDDVASAEEVANATIQQAQMKNPPDTHVRALEARCKNDGMPVEKLCESYKVKSLSDLTMEQYNHIHKNWSILLKMAKEEK